MTNVQDRKKSNNCKWKDKQQFDLKSVGQLNFCLLLFILSVCVSLVSKVVFSFSFLVYFGRHEPCAKSYTWILLYLHVAIPEVNLILMLKVLHKTGKFWWRKQVEKSRGNHEGGQMVKKCVQFINSKHSRRHRMDTNHDCLLPHRRLIN